MNVSFVHKDFEWSPKQIHGGTENCVANMASALSRLSCRTSVLGRFGSTFEYQGVNYIDVGTPFEPDQIASKLPLETDIAIIVSDLENVLALRNATNCKRVIWLHDDWAFPTVSDRDLDLVIFVSEAQRLFYEHWSKVKHVIIPNGFDPSIFFVEQMQVYDRIIYAGALVEEKGIKLLINAYKIARQDIPNTSLHIFGSEDLWGKSQNNLLGNFQGDGVHIQGKASQQRLRREYNQSLLSVIPSSMKLRLDPFPCSAIESQASGCPPIVSDCGGLPEAVINGTTGFVFPSESLVDLASIMIAAVQNRTNTLAMRHQCVRHTENHYRWDHLATRFLDAISVL